VLFLDEPTTGLDPRSRNELWHIIRELVGRGTTLLLTTQYLEEADRLADEIVVIDHGRKIAQGTARELKRMIGGERIEVTVFADEHVGAVREALAAHASGEILVDDATRTIVAPVSDGSAALTQVVRRLGAEHIAVDDIGLRRPTLDDVFLTLTGHRAEEAAAEPAPAKGRH
jgi:ABC-2 type transport system ATP-binding protein